MPHPRPTKAATKKPTAVNANAYAHLKERILGGAFGRDAWIPVDAIALELSVSRQPVMDAIRRLSFEGFVEIVPQVGSRVRRYSERDIRDFFVFFAQSEAYVARLAAERAEPQDIVSLRMISAQIGALARLSVPAADRGKLYRNLNRMFHFELRNIARSPALGELVEGLRDRSDFFIVSERGTVFTERIEIAFAEHEAIIDAIETRDGETAARAMMAHILAVEASVLPASKAGRSRPRPRKSKK